MKLRAIAASVGHSVWFSDDLGQSWLRAPTNVGGVYNESRCWCVCTHPARPGEVLSGTDQGLYRWAGVPGRWHHVPSPMEDLQILQLAQHPSDPDFIVAGCRPHEVFISHDGGTVWRRCRISDRVQADFINTPRVTSIQFDPTLPDTIWLTIEIDGVFRSDDRGVTWRKLVKGLRTDDTHNLIIFDDLGPRRVLCSTELGLHRSDDEGETWYHVPIPSAPYEYYRSMARRADRSGVFFLSVGDRPSGTEGFLFRSRDHGGTWEEVKLSCRVNSTIWWIGTNAADPMLIFFCTIMGQIWRSTNGGEKFQKMERELGELRQIAWAPMD
jgi:photosystem II stability/assembly factor-like uncharacterized protein